MVEAEEYVDWTEEDNVPHKPSQNNGDNRHGEAKAG